MSLAHLVLADGTLFPAAPYGAPGVAVGEVVFTTGTTGYEEVLTDPSFAAQIVTMTAPQIGNVGITEEDAESVSGKPHLAGFVLRDASPVASNYRAKKSLDAYLREHQIVGLTDLDTRKLTRHLRDHGSQNGAMGTASVDELLARARSAPSMVGRDLVREVTPKSKYTFAELRDGFRPKGISPRTSDKHVVVMDFGVKRNILRCLADYGFRVTAVPATTRAEEILSEKPDGIFLSSGPGDPAALGYAIETIRALLGKKPIFGICLGHQLLALALGAKTFKLKFGHRGLNQPVKDLATGRIEITTQNHGFCVDLATLPEGAVSTHVHLNDGTSEGIKVPELRAFSVQYHPEAAAGPHDSMLLFDRFDQLMGGASTIQW